MEAIFKLIAKEGRPIYSSPDDYKSYLIENEGEELLMSIKPLSKVAPKMRMYAYLFGPLMDCAVQGFTAAGYEGMDKVKARYKLQAEFAKEEMMGPNGIEAYLIDLSSMTKGRLLKFVQDCIFFLETELNQKVPDSSLYKMMKLTGKEFSSIKYNK